MKNFKTILLFRGQKYLKAIFRIAIFYLKPVFVSTILKTPSEPF